MRLVNLADVTRKWAQPYGIQVIEEAGWQTRGYDFPVGPDVAVRHWTAGPTTGIWPSGRILVHGRSDLPGPLCQLSQDRRAPGTLDAIHVVASGKANHAGAGDWNGTTGGNYETVGLEIEWSGPGEAFSPQRVLVSEIAMRALMDFCGKNTDDACEHREWANPPGRKIDTNLDGNVLRRRMAELGQTPAPNPTPNPTPEEDEVNLIVKGDASAEYWITNGITKTFVTADQAGALAFVGLGKWDNASSPPKPFQVPQSFLDAIPAASKRVEEWGQWLDVRAEQNEAAIIAAIKAIPASSGSAITDADAVKIAKAVVAEIAS